VHGTLAKNPKLRMDGMPECPVCGAEPTISDDPVEGELLECEECGVELEILALDPITLGEAPDAEEDWGE